jgi:hypothetical protein
MNQHTHTLGKFARTQNGRILAVLEEAQPHWVGMPRLVETSGSYAVHSRISDLRRMGYAIEQRSLRDGRKVWSYYRLAS